MTILYKNRLIGILILTLILFIGFATLYALADTIYLKNEQVIEGIVVSETDESIILKLSIGQVVISCEDIESIVKSSNEDNEELEERWRQLAEERKEEAKRIKEEIDIIEQEKKKQLEEKLEEKEEVQIEQTEKEPPPPEVLKKETSPRTKPKISIKNRRIYVNGSLYYVKGIAYGINYPECPGGMRGYKEINFSVFEKDFEVMEKVGINTIRTYEPLPVELLDLAHKHNIMVIENIVYPKSTTRYNSEQELTKLKKEAMAHAKKHKDHPAILMWSIWNDAPFTWGSGGNVVKRYGFKKADNFLKEIYLAVKSVDKSHPITGSNMLSQEGTELGFDFLDVIGVNAYIGGHGRWLGELNAKQTVKKLVRYSKKYDKPVVILETGYSTYVKSDVRKESQDEVLRAQIKITGENIAGITIFQWSDGWWKAGRPKIHDDHIEEHWGIVTGYRKPKVGLKAVAEMFNSIPTKSKGYKE